MSLLRFRPKLTFGAVGWLVVLVVLGSRMWPQVSAAFGVAAASERAPDFQLTTLSGEPVSLETLRGQVVVVNFWATWCPPCRVEMPGFQQVYEDMRAQGFTILGISTDATGSRRVADFLRERAITYPVAMASSAVVRDFGGVHTLPTTFLIDREGRIRYRVQGVFTEFALRQAVDRLLAESPAAQAAAALGDGR